MSNLKYPKTEWGLKVINYVQSHGISLKELARRADVSYDTFLAVRIGKTPGNKADIVNKVEAYMKSNPDPPISPLARTF